MGKAQADMLCGVVKGWQMPVLLPDERTILTAARFKAVYGLGIADSYVAAFAFNDNRRLVTKDPDFEALKNEIEIMWF